MNSTPPSITSACLVLFGVNCRTCAGEVHQALLEIPGVSRASVRLAEGRALVTFDPDITAPEVLVERLHRARFGAMLLPATDAGNGDAGTWV